MALGDDLLAKVTAEDMLIDSVLALLNGLVAQGVIPASTVTAINAKIQGSEDKLNAALAANTPPPPTP